MDILRATIFGGSISATLAVTRLLCPSASFEEASRAPLQPPREVFGVVWPMLFVTTGVAWVLAKRTFASDALYSTLTALCCLWLPLYTCLRYYRLSTLVLASCVAVAAATMATTEGAPERWLLVPLVTWLSFATYLNTYRVLSSK